MMDMSTLVISKVFGVADALMAFQGESSSSGGVNDLFEMIMKQYKKDIVFMDKLRSTIKKVEDGLKEIEEMVNGLPEHALKDIAKKFNVDCQGNNKETIKIVTGIIRGIEVSMDLKMKFLKSMK
ncbi:hypothetical protein E3N88_40409 [Mikania micrantha]|uniref:Uncharacterized protein n=1 Tax=Mikania micrantha TaxID=192012 RepID=A0A5N6LMH9_9ASTR|nr:hypothetical protein E3N88_40409 [Mikania micrantha]